jgi:hypothetical protein
LRQCGIYLQRTHDNNYVRIEPDELESDKLEEEILPPLARNKTKIFETVFVKAEVTGITWRKSDMCRRIAGFHFPSVDNDMDECEIWVSELAGNIPPYQCWEKEGTFSFDFEGQISAIARCRLDSVSDCSIEILVKYDCRKKYGEGDDRVGRSSKNSDTTDSDWVQSDCCEWKIEWRSCNQFEVSVTSWIELDDESDARIHVQFSDSGDHYACEVEEWEWSEDAVQNERGYAAGCFITFSLHQA